jgi:predicted metalloprotease
MEKDTPSQNAVSRQAGRRIVGRRGYGMKRILIVVIVLLLAGSSFSTALQPQKSSRQQKSIKAQLYSVEAQLRFWSYQEKSRVKASEAGQMSLTIGKNVRRLWQEKLDLQEAAEGLGVGIPPEPKRQVKNTREEEDK